LTSIQLEELDIVYINKRISYLNFRKLDTVPGVACHQKIPYALSEISLWKWYSFVIQCGELWWTVSI